MKLYFFFAIIALCYQGSESRWLCFKKRGKEGTISTIDKDTVTASNFHHGTHYACIYKGATLSVGQHTFDIIVQGNKETSNAVGLATEEDVRPGTEDRGFYYNYGTLVSPVEFSDELGDSYQETTIHHTSFLVELTEETMKVYMIENGKPLGLTLNIKKPPIPMFPSVYVSHNGKVIYKKTESKDSFIKTRDPNLPDADTLTKNPYNDYSNE